MPETRSPNYPKISLPEAIVRVRRLHDVRRQMPGSREVLVKGLGYSGISGASDRVFSALLKYGLVEKIGTKYRVSDRAMMILYPKSERESDAALLAAAKSPYLFADLFERYIGDFPDEAVLRSYLRRKGFTASAVNTVIGAYKETSEMLKSQGILNGKMEVRDVGFPAEQRASTASRGYLRRMKEPGPLPTADYEPDGLDGEHVLQQVSLGKDRNFKIVVRGEVRVKELDTIIQMLQLQKKLLEDEE